MFPASEYDYLHSDDDYETTQNDDMYNNDISFEYGSRKYRQYPFLPRDAMLARY